MMKEYWKRFEKLNHKGQLVRDGEYFEELVKCLLEEEYGCEWTQTGGSHDDNRDLYLYSDDHNIWAECKNYKKKIAMSTIAPTLVMAQIYEVDQILLFSSSPFNESARKKIYLFAEKTNKQLNLYDGDSLIQLIIKHNANLPSEFKIAAPTNINILNPHCDFLYIQNPIAGIAFEDKKILPLKNLTKIFYNSTFEIGVMINNPDALYHAVAQLSFETCEAESTEEQDISMMGFEIIDKNQNNLRSFNQEYQISPASGLFVRLFLRQRSYHELVTMPRVLVTVKTSHDGSIYKFKSPDIQVKSHWISRCRLIGTTYYSILDSFEHIVLGNDEIGILTLAGSSGTGKTRLIKESVDRLLKHKYRILSFIGDEYNDASVILQEIVFFLYEVPRSDILKEMEYYVNDETSQQGKNKAHTAYTLIKHFMNTSNPEDFMKAIDTWGTIIFEKISAAPIAILVDNVQFFGLEIAYFFLKYIEYSLNQNRSNESILVLSFNTDFINSESLNLFQWLRQLSSSNHPYILYKEVKGFEDDMQGVLFLRELMRIKHNNYDYLLEMIVKKVSAKPFYLTQAMEFLLMQHTFLQLAESETIPIPVSLIEKTILDMPEDIHLLLNKRWDYLTQNHNSDSLELIISCVFLFREIDVNIINLLKINNDDIELLIKRCFLQREISNQEVVIVFEHGIIENFFMQLNPNLPNVALDYIKANKLVSEISGYPFAYLLCNLDSLHTKATCIAILNKAKNIKMPSSLTSLLVEKWFACIQINCNVIQNSNQICEFYYHVCTKANEYMGITRSLKEYEKAFNYLTNHETELLLDDTGLYRKFINSYADILLRKGDINQAILFLKDKLQKSKDLLMEHSSDAFSDYLNANISLMYNRLHINYKCIDSSEAKKETQNTLELSRNYANQLKSKSLRDELTFMSNSDEGYCFYCFAADKQYVQKLWGCWKDYETILPQKTLNLKRKEVQLLLIDNHSTKALSKIQDAFEYLDTGAFSYEKLAFKTFYINAKLVALIQENVTRNKNLIRRVLASALEESFLIPSGRDYKLFQIAGIFSFYLGNMLDTYHYFMQSYIELKKNPYQTNHNGKIQLLVENIIYAAVAFDMNTKHYDFSFLCEDLLEALTNALAMNEIEKTKFIETWQAQGVIRTADSIFNFPLL